MSERHESTVVESQLLDVHGLTIAMQIQGDGEPLLLINGLTRSLHSWEPFAAELTGRTVVTFDLPGVGGSPTPLLPLSIPRLAAVAAGVMDACGLPTADVLGFSYGGAVAQQLAVDAPDRMRGLVLVATSCGLGAIPGDAAAVLRSVQTSDRDAWPAADALGTWWHSLAFAGWSSIPFLGAIRAPTLVVCGTHDRVVPGANGQILAGRIPDATLVTVPGGHDLQRGDSVSALAGVVDSFLATAGRARVHGGARRPAPTAVQHLLEPLTRSRRT